MSQSLARIVLPFEYFLKYSFRILTATVPIRIIVLRAGFEGAAMKKTTE
jgi:hypothetical protein